MVKRIIVILLMITVIFSLASCDYTEVDPEPIPNSRGTMESEV